jgi:hypothetical protein
MNEEGLEHMCGFTGPAMFSNRIDFDFQSENIPDWMHNLANVFLMLMEIMCGANGNSFRAKAWASNDCDRRHRAECELFNIFREVWLGRKEKLAEDVRTTLLQPTDADIASTTRPVLERMARVVGEKTNGLTVAEVREKVVRIRTELRQPGDYFYTPLKPNPLPWRLSREAFDQVDKRICNMSFPHNTPSVIAPDGNNAFDTHTCAPHMHTKLPAAHATKCFQE